MKIKLILAAIATGLLVFTLYPDPVQDKLRAFNELSGAETSFIGKINPQFTRMVKVEGKDTIRLYFRRPTKDLDLVKLMWETHKSCIFAETKNLSDYLYRREAQKMGINYITLCPIGDRQAFMGAGFVDVPSKHTSELQRLTTEEIEWILKEDM